MQSSREWGLFFVLRKGRKKGRKKQPTSAVGCKTTILHENNVLVNI